MIFCKALITFIFLFTYCFSGSLDFESWINKIEANNIKASVGVWDLKSGNCIESYCSDLSLIPASTTKLISTYAILKTLKPHFQLDTEVWGDLRGSSIYGDLIIKGFGDPFLTSERIWLLINKLKKLGVLNIIGDIRLDQSAFDNQIYGNGWHNTSVNTTPPILPLSVNFNRENGKITNNPEILALNTIRKIILDSGISIKKKKISRVCQKRLISFQSLPLRDLIISINKVSNNFMIEMLLKYFGNGKWSAGISRIQDFYNKTLNLNSEKICITDGSGLSKENRVSAKTLAIILRAIWYDFEVGPEMISSLKTYINENQRNTIFGLRCKTGHLNNVISVCGYLQNREGELKIFAIILNGLCEENDIVYLINKWAN